MSEHKIDEADGDIRLDRWFKRHKPELTHGFLEKCLRKGDIRIDGKKAKTSDRVQPGQVITMREQKSSVHSHESEESHEPRNASLKPSHQLRIALEDVEMIQASVLYKDSNVIVINKPPGLAVQGGSKVTKSVDGLLSALRFDAAERPRLVHRLDRDTSGVLVLARSARVAAELMKAFSGKTAEKTYWALVKGVPEAREGKIDLPVTKQEEGNVEKVVVDEEEGKRAVTLYRVIDNLSKTLAWVELKPITGRTHQLRVHMAAIGHPILGDGKYGGRDSFIDGLGMSRKLHLHARHLSIPGVLNVTAALPRHMKESFAMLGLEE